MNVRNLVFFITVLLQVAGPIYVGFGNWCNIIQYLGGFGIPLATYHFYRKMKHLHDKHDLLSEELKLSKPPVNL